MLISVLCFGEGVGTKIDLADLTLGEQPPKVVDGGLSFDASVPGIASSAALKEAYDLSVGIKVALEFRIFGPQSNVFPRLFDGGKLSLHLQMEPYTKHYKIKFLVSVNSDVYQQIVEVVEFEQGAWQKVEFTYEPQGRVMSLKVGDNQLSMLPLSEEARGLTGKVNFILGNNQLKAGGKRGFTGEIRNVVVTSPYDPNPREDEATFSKPSVGGEPVRHSVVSHLRGRHLAFPGFDILPNGEWVVVFREGEAHVCPYGRICLVRSRDGGLNWSAPVSISDTASDERDPSIHALPDGRVLVTHGGWNSWMFYAETKDKFPGASAYIQQVGERNFGGSRFLFSSDGCETWSISPRGDPFCPHGPMFVEGRFLMASAFRRDGSRIVECFASDGNAQNWESLGRIGSLAKDSVIDFQEPHLLSLRDGSLLVAIREPEIGFMYISRSVDGGRTWTTPEKTPIRGFPAHLLELRDGRVLASYGYRYFPYGIRACLSNDGGKTWDMEHEFILQNNGLNVDLGYPVTRELPNGEMATIYYHVTAERRDCFIEAARWKLPAK